MQTRINVISSIKLAIQNLRQGDYVFLGTEEFFLDGSSDNTQLLVPTEQNLAKQIKILRESGIHFH